MNSLFLCPHCSLSMEAEPEHFGAECSCPECSQTFRIPSAEAVIASTQNMAQMQSDRERLEKVMADLRGQLSSFDAEAKHLKAELDDARQGLSELKKRNSEQENEVALLKKNLTEAETLSSQSARILEERNRLQERIQELNVQRNASEPVPETWNFSASRRQEENRSSVSGIFYLGAGLFLGVALMVLASPFLFHRYPGIAEVFHLVNKGGASTDSDGEATEHANRPASSQVEGEEGLSQKLTKGAVKVDGKRMPETFLGFSLGVPFASALGEKEKDLWKESNGRFHRKTELLGQEVSAVLVPDQKARLAMGAYLRVCSKEIAELTPFLEWAVSVQDSMSEAWGDPSAIHQISGVTDINQVVIKIKEGGDFYEAEWKRDDQDTFVVLSIRSINDRSVAFRLEYKSTALTKELLQAPTELGVSK